MLSSRYNPSSLYTELCDRLENGKTCESNEDRIRSTTYGYNAHTYNDSANAIAGKIKVDELRLLIKNTQIAMCSSDTDVTVKAQKDLALATLKWAVHRMN